jgi:hypothetical protein
MTDQEQRHWQWQELWMYQLGAPLAQLPALTTVTSHTWPPALGTVTSSCSEWCWIAGRCTHSICCAQCSTAWLAKDNYVIVISCVYRLAVPACAI